jgi:glycosyltransferase involved in cell wall biosynthesis
MKLLFICESFPTSEDADLTGGVESKDYYVGTGLGPKHKVLVLTSARSGVNPEDNFNQAQIIRIGRKVNVKDRESPIARLSFAFSALRTGLAQDFDLVQGSNVFTQLLAFIIGTVKHKPTVAVIPDIYIGSWIKNTGLVTGIVGEILERIVVRLPWTRIISWSDSTREKLIAAGVEPKLISVIPGGVDYELCQKLKVNKQNRPTITFAARLVRYKRAEDLIRAIEIIKKQIPEIKLKIIGTGIEADNLKKLVKTLKLEPHVDFIGFVPKHKNVLEVIKSSQLFCLPSIVEGFGLVTIEAMACGVPYVNSRIPPTQEVTQQGKGGLLFEPRSTKQLASQVIKLLTDKALYRRKVKEGIETAKMYSWEKICQDTEKTFEEIIRQAKNKKIQR